jgi:hypothetical protein
MRYLLPFGRSSDFGFDGERQFVSPAGESRSRDFTGFTIGSCFREQGSFGVGKGELAIELKIFEPVHGDVVAAGGVNETGDTGPIAGDQTHGAGLAAGVHHGVFHEVAPEFCTGGAESHDFGVGGGIPEFDDRAGARGDDFPVDDDESAEGGFAFVFEGVPGELDGLGQEGLVVLALRYVRHLISNCAVGRLRVRAYM